MLFSKTNKENHKDKEKDHKIININKVNHNMMEDREISNKEEDSKEVEEDIKEDSKVIEVDIKVDVVDIKEIMEDIKVDEVGSIKVVVVDIKEVVEASTTTVEASRRTSIPTIDQ